MTSVFIAIGIVYFVFWGIIFCRRQYRSYSNFELACFYLVTRVGPAAMLQSGQASVWRNVLLEWVVLAFLVCYVRKRKNKAFHSMIYTYYLFFPFTGIGILSGRMEGLCLVFVTAAFFYLCDRFIWDRNGILMRFLPANPASVPEEEYSSKSGGKSDSMVRESRMTIRDVILLLLFTAVFAAVVLYRLGSTQVPETYRDLKVGETGENEIVLNFDQEVELSEIYIFLGYTGNVPISFSRLDTQSSEWTLFDSKHSIENVFAWNKVSAEQTLTALGMVLTEGNARIHEIICLDRNGSRILPDNADDYGELFDEQELFPEVPSYYDQTIFDEVFYARTAYEFLHKLPIYEMSHPPLGKILISLGIRMFGMNPFGWRIVCAVFGILMIPVLYCFSHKMFGGTGPACFSTVLLATAFMNYVLARMATLDIIAAFFILLMFFFMYGFTRCCSAGGRFRKQVIWLLLCGCSMACAVSVKWTGLYAAAGIAVLFFVSLFHTIQGVRNIRRYKAYLWKLGAVCTVSFLIIPAVVYTLSFLPYIKAYPDYGLVEAMMISSRFMLSYHSSILFEHPYSSEWYQWLIGREPLLDSFTVLQDGRVRAISTFGNPLLIWGGLVSWFYQIWLWREKNCKSARFLCIAAASVLIPWLFIHRTAFIYQYFPCMLFLVLMITNSVCHLRGRKGAMIGIVCLSLGLFLLFFPVLSGSAVDTGYVNHVLKWFPVWKQEAV